MWKSSYLSLHIDPIMSTATVTAEFPAHGRPGRPHHAYLLSAELIEIVTSISLAGWRWLCDNHSDHDY